MRLVTQLPINTQRFEAHAASDARWVASLLWWIGAVLEWIEPIARDIPWLRAFVAESKAGVIADLRGAIRDLRIVVTAHAGARLRVRKHGARETLHPGGTRGHALRARRFTRLTRCVTGGLFRDMHQGSLRQRAERVAAALANLESLIARALERLTAMWRHIRAARCAVLATRELCADTAFAYAPACADTS